MKKRIIKRVRHELWKCYHELCKIREKSVDKRDLASLRRARGYLMAMGFDNINGAYLNERDWESNENYIRKLEAEKETKEEYAKQLLREAYDNLLWEIRSKVEGVPITKEEKIKNAILLGLKENIKRKMRRLK